MADDAYSCIHVRTMTSSLSGTAGAAVAGAARGEISDLGHSQDTKSFQSTMGRSMSFFLSLLSFAPKTIKLQITGRESINLEWCRECGFRHSRSHHHVFISSTFMDRVWSDQNRMKKRWTLSSQVWNEKVKTKKLIWMFFFSSLCIILECTLNSGNFWAMSCIARKPNGFFLVLHYINHPQLRLHMKVHTKKMECRAKRNESECRKLKNANFILFSSVPKKNWARAEWKLHCGEAALLQIIFRRKELL